MAKKYFELAFELSGKTDKSLGSAFKGLKVDINDLNKKIANLEKSRGDTKRFEGLRKDIIKTNREYNDAQKNVNRLAREIKNTANPTKELQNEFEKAKNKASSLKTALSKQKDELTNIKTKMNEAGVSTKNFAQDQAKLEKKLRDVTKAQANYSKAKGNLEAAKAQQADARGRLVDAAVIGAAVAVPVKLAIDAEETMADIKKVVDFDSEIEFKNMEKTIMGISKNIPMSFNEIGEIIAAGGQAGIDKIDLERFAIDSAKMGIAFDIEAGDAGQTMAEWRSAFRMNQEEVYVLADKINYLGDTTAASAPRISEIVTRIGPLGEIGGVASGEIAALGATLVGMGVGEEIAATGIKNLMLTMVKGTAATKKQKAVYKELGIDAEVMAKKMQTDSKGAILELMEALKKVPEHARAAKLEQLVGKESIAAIAPLLTNIQELERNFDRVNEAQSKFSGSMESEFQARSATTANSIQLLKNEAQNMGITLGNVLLPPIVDLTSKFGGVATKVQEFADKHPELTANIVKVTAAVMAFTIGIIAITYIFSTLKVAYLSVKAAFVGLKLLFVEGKIQAIGHAIATKALSVAQFAQAGASKVAAAAQWLVNAALSANPIALVIIAIAALIAIGVALYKNFDVVREKVDHLWGIFADKFPGMAEFAESAAGVIKSTFGKAIEWVSGKVEWLGTAWDNTVGKLFKGGKSKGKNTGNGGKVSSTRSNLPPVVPLPGYAKGGIVNTPQIAWVGEGKVSEAIIPLEKTANSIGLWERAGRALGVDVGPRGIDIASKRVSGKESVVNNSKSDGDKYEFNFNIDATGASLGIEESIKQKLLQEVIPIILRLLDDKDKDKLRVKII